ncbi:MAG TPA: acylphosphatase [Nitrospirales bacterium]|nr:acylphosphatase [Nitrospirales bacterium]
MLLTIQQRNLDARYPVEEELKEQMEKIVRAHACVSGTVQGVGFRAFVQMQANRRSLHGWVRNRAGGEVELEVEGPHASVQTFLQTLHKGPPLSQVLQVIVDWKDPNRQTEGFQILRTFL